MTIRQSKKKEKEGFTMTQYYLKQTIRYANGNTLVYATKKDNEEISFFGMRKWKSIILDYIALDLKAGSKLIDLQNDECKHKFISCTLKNEYATYTYDVYAKKGGC